MLTHAERTAAEEYIFLQILNGGMIYTLDDIEAFVDLYIDRQLAEINGS